MTTSPTISLVIPLFDEADRLPRSLPHLLDWVRQPARELVLVDDGSTDRTADIAQTAIDGIPGTCLVSMEHNGKGQAVAAGIARASGDVVAFCDADLSTPLDEVDRLTAEAGRAWALVIGSRGMTTSRLERRQHRGRELLGQAFNLLVQAMVLPGIKDTQCGAKAAPAAVWRDVLAHCTETGWAWDVEVLAVARARDVPIRELAVRWSHQPGSRVRLFRDGAAMVGSLDRIRRRTRMLGRSSPASEVFDAVNAAALAAADDHHWWFRSKAAFVAHELPRAPSGPLVDLGAGSGGVTSKLGWRGTTVATDGNLSLTAAARDRYGLSAVACTVDQQPISTGSVTVVVALDVLEHLARPEEALAEARRMLSPSGVLVVTVPAHPWLWSGADEALGHVRRYRRRELRALLQEAGFELRRLTHVFSWLVLPVWLARRRRSDELGLGRRGRALDLAALVLTAIEARALRVISLPIGTSILAVGTPSDR